MDSRPCVCWNCVRGYSESLDGMTLWSLHPKNTVTPLVLKERLPLLLAAVPLTKEMVERTCNRRAHLGMKITLGGQDGPRCYREILVVR